MSQANTVRPHVPEAPEPSLDELVELAVLDMVARGLPEGFAFGFVPLAVVVGLLHAIHAPAHLATWAAIVALVLVLGVAFGFAYGRHPASQETAARWQRAMYGVVGASGLTWGLAGWLFVPAPWQAEVVLLTLLMGLSAAVLANIGASLPHYLVFLAGTLMPTVVHRAALGGVTNLGLCAGAVVMMIVLAVFAARLAASTRSSLRISHENRRLARALEIRTQEAERANRDKSRFVAAASHDLRQPVHALGLLLDVLKGQPLSPPSRATADRMSQVLASLESLFAGLLDISRLDSGAIEPRRIEFPLQPVLDGLVQEFEPLAGAKGLALRCRPTAAWVNSDPLLLERILRNLISNAVRYTDRGGVLIVCRPRRDLLAVEVRDSGIGIDAADHAAIFDEFHQVADTGRDAGRGLGLGLAIVRRLTLLLDHPVEVRSSPGRGSVFRIALPRVPAPAVPVLADPAPPDAMVAAGEVKARCVPGQPASGADAPSVEAQASSAAPAGIASRACTTEDPST
ncbi:MAG: hypothetical protein IPK20_18005 [Betaproteobacteria bacterium]|nr:hypothetical protein [Betaproteobacteria bacterium]